MYLHNLSAHLVPVSPMLESLKDVNLWGVFYPFQDFSTKIVAVCLIIILTLVNTRAIKSSARLGQYPFIPGLYWDWYHCRLWPIQW
jgi:APA family basic amino acid/polyamine antiporter